MKYSDFCKILYSHKTKSRINTQAWFVQSMFLSAGSNYFPTRPDSTNSYEKKLYQGKPITKSIAESILNIDIDGLYNFFKSNINKNDIEKLFLKFSFPDSYEKDFDYFCTALAYQFAEFIKQAPDEADDSIIKDSYKSMVDQSFKKVTLTKTLVRGEDFNKIFTLVNHNEKLSIINECQLNLYHLNTVNNRFSFDVLESFLLKNIIRYANDRLTIDKFINNDNLDILMAKTLKSFRELMNAEDEWINNELGNILIYMFLEHVLNAPKIYSRIELINKGNEAKAISGGSIHLLSRDNDSLPFNQIIFGKSNINNDIKNAIDSAFESILTILTNTTSEFNLIENTILYTSFPKKVAEKLTKIIIPKESYNNQVDNSFGVFLGYSLSLPNVSNESFKDVLSTKMSEDIKSVSKYIQDKIQHLNLINYSFYFYFLPFNDADLEKRAIIDNVLNGGR